MIDTHRMFVIACATVIAATTACTKPRPKTDAAAKATEQQLQERIRELTEQLAQAKDREKAAQKNMADAVEKAAKSASKPRNEDLPIGERMVRVWDYNANMVRTVRIDTIDWTCETDKDGRRVNFSRVGTKWGPKKEFVFGVEVRDEQSEALIRQYLGLKPL